MVTPYAIDSFMVKGFLSKEKHNDLFKALKKSSIWVDRNRTEMKMRGHSLNRTKFFMVRRQPGDISELGCMPDKIPRYYYTGWQVKSLQFYRHMDYAPTVVEEKQSCISQLCERLDNEFKTVNNHVIGTIYYKETDEIGWHNDKVKDIADGSNILMVSLGDTRVLGLAPSMEDGKPDLSKQIRVTMEPGSVFVLGPKTNSTWKHCIFPPAKGSEFSPRISLVFRNIKTIFTKEQIQQGFQTATKSKESRLKRKQYKKEQSKQQKKLCVEVSPVL
jgi:alkylated DNA repair dioxygenase AlkB